MHCLKLYVCVQAYIGSLGRSPRTLFELHLIRDRLHAVYGHRHSHGVLDIAARAHEAAQLNDALERLDFDTPGDLKLGILEIRSDRIARETRVAQSVEGGEQRRGPGERSNERGRGIESRRARRGYVAEERTDEDGADDT